MGEARSIVSDPDSWDARSSEFATSISVWKALNYLRVVPGSLSDAMHLYAAYLRTAAWVLREPRSFGTVGERLYSSSPVRIRYSGLSAYVRPQSDDLAIITANHEPEVMNWFHPRAGELVVDVGAHIGTYTLRAAQAGADVVAFEPNPESYRILCANVALNRFTRVVCRNVALGSTNGVAHLHVPSVYLGRASIDRVSRETVETTVPVVRLDDAIASSLNRPIDWLKIDVEGSETETLEGATQALRRTKRIVIEVAHGNEARVERLLSGPPGFARSHVSRQPTAEYWLLIGRSDM